jgi:hypothetical protein
MGHHAMATKDGFDPGDPLPLFLSADEPDQGIGNDKPVIPLRGLMSTILVAAAIALGIANLSERVTLFADVTASPVDKLAPQPATDQSTPTTPITQSAVIQSTADAEALPPTAKDVPTREINASEPSSQPQAENTEASSEALFREFQAWAAEQDARALARPVQDAPAPVAENARAPVQRQQKQPRARSIHDTQPEIGSIWRERVRDAQADIRRIWRERPLY